MINQLHLYTKQLAYYSQTPNGWQTNRFLDCQVLGVEIIFPEINHLQYILNLLDDIGYYINNTDGILPLSYTEINSFIKASNIKLNRLETTLLKNLSVTYVNTYYLSKNEDFEQPYKL